MAAGMGSRYGGLKQIDPVGNHGQLLLDYSIYDAKRAGFETVIFVIKREIEQAFHEAIGNRFSGAMHVEYAYQELDDLPEGYCVPEGRTKPWRTAHAILAARKLVRGPFAVVNADDYYGPQGCCQANRADVRDIHADAGNDKLPAGSYRVISGILQGVTKAHQRRNHHIIVGILWKS